MSKLQDWEYDDAMHDYLRWQDALEKLLEDEEPDEYEVATVRKRIANLEDALFGDDYKN